MGAVLCFSCVTEVSCAVLCSAERYRLQSDHMEALVLFAEELLERLSKHFHGRVRNTTHGQTDRQTDFVWLVKHLLLATGVREVCCVIQVNLLLYSSGAEVSSLLLKYTSTQRVL